MPKNNAVRISVHRRPKAGDVPHEGLLKPKRRGFRCLGFRGSRDWGVSGFREEVGVQGFGVQVFRCLGSWTKKKEIDEQKEDEARRKKEKGEAEEET